jgi:TolC family type I secretion outer membrane protein
MKPHAPHPFLRRPLTAFVLGAMLAQPLWAIDLGTAYELAQTQDANVLAAKAATDARRERLPQARSQLMPNIAFSNDRNKNRLKTTAPDFYGNTSTTKDGYISGNAVLQLRQPLYRRALLLDLDQAKFNVADAEASLETEYQNLAVKVTGAYFEALLARDHLQLIQSQKSFLSAQLDSAQRGFAAGNGTRTDIDEARARLDMTLAQEVEARQNIDYTRRQLEVFVQQPIDSLAPLDAAKLDLSLETRSLDEWIAAVEDKNSDIRALKARVEAARLDISKAQSGHLPTLDGTMQWSVSKSENQTAITSSYNTKAVGVTLTIPIFSGGAVSSQVRQAVATLEQTQQNLESARRDLQGRVHQDYRAITEGAFKIKALEQAARSGAQLVDSAVKSKSAGARTQLDVLNAQQQLVKTQEDLATARYQYVMALVRLWSHTNEVDATQLARVNAWLTPQ